jgi:hypothetical protein
MEYVSPFSRSWKRERGAGRHGRYRCLLTTPIQEKETPHQCACGVQTQSVSELNAGARERENGSVEVRCKLTEFVRMFRTNSGNNSIGESRRPLWLSLIDELSNPRPALAFPSSLRRVLRKALQEADRSRLEVLHDIYSRGRVGVGRGVRDVYAGERYGSIDGWGRTSQAHAGDAGEGEEVGFVRVGAGTDEAGDAGGNAPLVDGGVALVLDDRYGGEDGVAGGGLDEADEDVCDVPR